MLTRVKGEMALSWFVNPISFGHGGSNNPGWRCFLLGYADLPWNGKPHKDDGATNTAVDVPPRCGISVMTNAATGNAVLWRIIHAITYLKGWPQGSSFYGNQPPAVPFRAPINTTDVSDSAWKEWIGWWSDTGRDANPTKWRIAQDGNGRAVAGIDGLGEARLCLRPAAVPAMRYGEGKESIDLLLDGTEIMLRLGWDKSERIVEVWNEAVGESTTLHGGKESERNSG